MVGCNRDLDGARYLLMFASGIAAPRLSMPDGASPGSLATRWIPSPPPFASLPALRSLSISSPRRRSARFRIAVARRYQFAVPGLPGVDGHRDGLVANVFDLIDFKAPPLPRGRPRRIASVARAPPSCVAPWGATETSVQKSCKSALFSAAGTLQRRRL